MYPKTYFETFKNAIKFQTGFRIVLGISFYWILFG